MQKRTIQTTEAPAAIGPYSQAVVVGSMVYTSGQIALDPSTGQLVPGGITPETERVMQNLTAVLAAAGCTLDDVIKTTIFLTNLNDFATVNEIYGRHLGASAPARSTVGVQALPRGASVEIEAVAVLPA